MDNINYVLRDWRADAEAHASVFGALQQLEASVLLEDADLPLAVAPPAKPAADTL